MSTTSMNLDDVDAFLDVSKPIVDGLREQAGGVKSLDDLCKASCDGAPSSSVVAEAVLIPATWADNDADLRVLWATLRLNGGGSMNTSALASASGVDVPDGSYSPLDDAMHSLNEIRDLLDTARQDDDNNRGVGSVDGNQHWSTNDLKAMIDNEDGYYTDEQVAHAKKVLALIEASPEALEYLGIEQSGGGWDWGTIGHITLDVLGVVPGVGNIADGINAAWYLSEGKYLDAALSSMGAIPAIGQAVTFAKPAIKAAAAGMVFKSLDEAMAWARKWLDEAGVIGRNSDGAVDAAGTGRAAIPSGTSDDVLSIPPGQRPDPSTYMSPGQIDEHLALFDGGAVRITDASAIEKYGTAGPNGGFVMPKTEFDRLMAETGGDLGKMEDALGLNPGSLSSGDSVAVHIDADDVSSLRVPSGNEGGVNSQWLPGGYTSGGVPEAVMDFDDVPFTVLEIGGS